MQQVSNNKSTRLPQRAKRLTSQRAVIFEIIRGESGHLDARDIHRQAQEKLPRLSLSTVYRNLELLKSSGVIEELRWAPHRHYETKAKTQHHHLVCLGCGRIQEFKYPILDHLRKIPQVQQFDIREIEINLYGYCPQCQKEGECGPTKSDTTYEASRRQERQDSRNTERPKNDSPPRRPGN